MDKNQIISWAKFIVGWPLSLISIAFILKLIIEQDQRINISSSQINVIYLLIGILLFFVYYFLRSFLWKTLLLELGHKVDLRENTYRFSISEFKRYTPGNVWSFLSRGSLFNEIGVNKKSIAVSILADIQLVIIGCFLFSLFSFPFILSSNGLQTKVSGIIPISFLAMAIFFFGTSIIYTKKYQGGNFLANIILPGFNLKSKLKVSAFSLILYGLFGIANFFVFSSVFDLGFSMILALSSFFTFALLVGFLSFLTPTGLGVRELVITIGLSQLLSTADAGISSIFTRIVLVLSEISFVVIVIIWEKSAKR